MSKSNLTEAYCLTCSRHLKSSAMRKFCHPCFAVLALLAACTKQEPESPPVPECAGTSSSAAGRVVVQYREELQASTNPAPGLRCRDEVQHPCGNYMLAQTVTPAYSNGLSINFTGAVAPSLCLTNLDYAYSRVDLGTLVPGNYAVAWQAGSKQTTGAIRVLADRVEVTSCDSNTVAVRYPVTYRIPATALWGQAYARTPAAQAAVAVVLDSLRKEGAVPLMLPAGHYSHFEVGSTGQLIPIPASQNGQPATAVTTPVLLSYPGNFARIKGVIKRRPQAADLSFGLSSAHGEYAW